MIPASNQWGGYSVFFVSASTVEHASERGYGHRKNLEAGKVLSLKKANRNVRSPQHEVKFAEEPHSSPIPQPLLDCVQTLLQPYLNPGRWNKVRDAILAVNGSKPEPVQDRFLSTEEIGELLHVSRVTIFRYMRAGKIKSHKLGRRNLYSVAEVMAAVKGGNE